MLKKQMVIGSGDLSPDFSFDDTRPKLGPVANYIFGLTGKKRPKICYVGTASGDSPLWISRFYDACKGKNVEPSHLQLFKKPNYENLRHHLLAQDAIWVAGGSTANLLAVWKVHGLMDILLEAQANGTILGGYSAGCVCWSIGGTTDSYGDTLRLLVNQYAPVPYSMCVHYDVESQRRPLYLKLIEDEELPAGYATDEGVSVHFIDNEVYKIISDTPAKAAYHVYKDEKGKVIEEKLQPLLVS